MATINISKSKIEKEKGVVILSLKEYQKLCQRAAPTYYLKGKEARELDRLVEKELEEHKKGETISASSLKEALRIYGRKKNKKN